ncbi:MAG: MdtA/MuxA family multidrug efflux RND transporter periplasmic adaptor subunit [Caulobacter sp.]|nr:MdtA/MuxA family multidrug efflux RND transporter periplasmic adaptor subunit [Vitreoscilla sp.]
MEKERLNTATPPAPKKRRWLGTVIAVVLVVGLGALAWYLTHKPAAGAGGGAGGPPGAGGPGGPGGGGRRGGQNGTTVGVASVIHSDIPIYVDALGTVTPSATVTVTPQVSGVLTKVPFQEGQMVKAGQLLATIEPRPFELALMQAQGQLQRDEATLDAANVTLKRYQTLLQQDSIARQDVDTQAATVKQSQGTVLGDQAAVGTAKLNLAWTRITAPVSGRVGLRSVDIGNLVSSGTSGGITTITELAPIDVEFAIPQDRIPQLQARIAAGAVLAVSAMDRTRTQLLDTGAFLSLNNQSDTQTGTVRAKARFSNAKNALFPSQFVNVRILLDTLKDALVVPVTALRHGPNGDFVYLLNDDHTVSQVTVVQGVATADTVQITKGLTVGERVITEGGDRLKDGARVSLPGDAASGPRRGASGAASGAWGASGASGARGGHHRRASEAQS